MDYSGFKKKSSCVWEYDVWYLGIASTPQDDAISGKWVVFFLGGEGVLGCQLPKNVRIILVVNGILGRGVDPRYLKEHQPIEVDIFGATIPSSYILGVEMISLMNLCLENKSTSGCFWKGWWMISELYTLQPGKLWFGDPFKMFLNLVKRLDISFPMQESRVCHVCFKTHSILLAGWK